MSRHILHDDKLNRLNKFISILLVLRVPLEAGYMSTTRELE